jgi:hypothetical protein
MRQRDTQMMDLILCDNERISSESDILNNNLVFKFIQNLIMAWMMMGRLKSFPRELPQCPTSHR